jgi:hypothetical protein
VHRPSLCSIQTIAHHGAAGDRLRDFDSANVSDGGPNADVHVESDLAPIADGGRAPRHVAAAKSSRHSLDRRIASALFCRAEFIERIERGSDLLAFTGILVNLG